MIATFELRGLSCSRRFSSYFLVEREKKQNVNEAGSIRIDDDEEKMSGEI